MCSTTDPLHCGGSTAPPGCNLCTAATTCVNGQCVCTTHAQCGTGSYCSNLAGGSCGSCAPTDGQHCGDATSAPGCTVCSGGASSCVSGACACTGSGDADTCVFAGAGICSTGACAVCTSNGQCGTDRCCVSGGCTPLASTWTQVIPTGTPPSGRYETAGIWDVTRARMVVYGGYGSSGVSTTALSDAWVLAFPATGSPAWSLLGATGPGARYRHSAVYDSAGERMIVFGGSSLTTTLSDVWALNLATDTWTQVSPTGTAPSARRRHAAVYDAANQRMLVFGGETSAGSRLNDVWALSLPTGGSPAWTNMTPAAGAAPPVRYRHTAVADTVGQRMIVFGGYGSISPYNLNDVWAFDLSGATWTQLLPAGTAPSARYAHAAAFDVPKRRMLVFGGYASGVKNDLYALGLGANLGWATLAPTSVPPARDRHIAIYDPSGRLLVFGGYGSVSPYYLNDVWSFSLTAACSP